MGKKFNFFCENAYIFRSSDDRCICKVNQVGILQFIPYSYVGYTCRARMYSDGDREVSTDIYKQGGIFYGNSA